MTRQRRLIFGLADLRAIAFQCDYCSARISMDPREAARNLPKSCPQHHEWQVTNLESGQPHAATRLVEALAGALTRGGRTGFNLQLEFDEETEAKKPSAGDGA